jgi:phage shock protein C
MNMITKERIAMTKKLYRSRKDYMLAGICDGLGEYFDIDPTIISLAVAFSIFLGGGIFVYLIAWIVISLEPEESSFCQSGPNLNIY